MLLCRKSEGPCQRAFSLLDVSPSPVVVSPKYLSHSYATRVVPRRFSGQIVKPEGRPIVIHTRFPPGERLDIDGWCWSNWVRIVQRFARKLGNLAHYDTHRILVTKRITTRSRLGRAAVLNPRLSFPHDDDEDDDGEDERNESDHPGGKASEAQEPRQERLVLLGLSLRGSSGGGILLLFYNLSGGFFCQGFVLAPGGEGKTEK